MLLVGCILLKAGLTMSSPATESIVIVPFVELKAYVYKPNFASLPLGPCAKFPNLQYVEITKSWSPAWAGKDQLSAAETALATEPDSVTGTQRAQGRGRATKC